jgi:hypothetical protein
MFHNHAPCRLPCHTGLEGRINMFHTRAPCRLPCHAGLEGRINMFRFPQAALERCGLGDASARGIPPFIVVASQVSGLGVCRRERGPVPTAASSGEPPCIACLAAAQRPKGKHMTPKGLPTQHSNPHPLLGRSTSHASTPLWRRRT